MEPSDSLSVGQAIEALAEEGYNLIFNLEYDFAALIDGTGATGNIPIAEQYPDTTFVIYNDNPNVNEDGSVKFGNVFVRHQRACGQRLLWLWLGHVRYPLSPKNGNKIRAFPLGNALDKHIRWIYIEKAAQLSLHSLSDLLV